MIFFTKTCTRDAERVVLQMKAIRRLFPKTRHIVMIESDENRRALPAIQEAASELTAVVRVEDGPSVIRVAMAIKNPYLRQQYLKLVAPLVYGDMVQLDSDMCPWTVCPFVDNDTLVYGTKPRWLPRWYFNRVPRKAILPAVEKWETLYTHVFRTGLSGSLLRSGMTGSFMLEQNGWFLRQDVAKAFVEAFEKAMDKPLHEALIDLHERKFLISEYQLFGTWAYANMHDKYEWIDAQAPTWCHHFPSTEPIESWMWDQLREAAGKQ